MNRLILSAVLTSLLVGCADTVPPTSISQPLVVRPKAVVPSAANGSIYQASAPRSWFEDHQPHQVGDNITVQLEEQISASSNSNNAAERSGSLSTQVGGAGGTTSSTFGGLLNGLNLTLTHDNKFAGTGQTTAADTFSGLITVSVTDILSNGNLVIAGERQVNIRGETSYVRVSGIVSPADIQTGNVVSSTRVADARIESVGSGTVATAEKAGWLQRFFYSFMPF